MTKKTPPKPKIVEVKKEQVDSDTITPLEGNNEPVTNGTASPPFPVVKTPKSNKRKAKANKKSSKKGSSRSEGN